MDGPWIQDIHARSLVPKPTWKPAHPRFKQQRQTTNRRRLPLHLLQGLFVVLLIVSVIVNIIFILNAGDKQHALKLNEIVNRSHHIEVISTRSHVSVTVGRTVLVDDSVADVNRGIHVVVLNQFTGKLMAWRVFDTYTATEDEELIHFIDSISVGRILVFAIKLGQEARRHLASLGSEAAYELGWRHMWAMVTVKAGAKFAESHTRAFNTSTWGESVVLTVDVTIQQSLGSTDCDWSSSVDVERRRAFCSVMEGYGNVCRCHEPEPISFNPSPIENNRVSHIPVIVIASDRPHYLYRMLKSLLSADGVNNSAVTVFIDGLFQGPVEVCKLFDVKAVMRNPNGVGNARISQHYKASISATFILFPEAQYVIIIEEDLYVSIDFFSYFSQTIHLVDEDDSIYCISAWNDQGYEHSCSDPTLLYRVEGMPGLGWLLKRSLFVKELEPQWPSKYRRWDWDIWMRMNSVRRDRECIIPDVSRTYHFGSTGLNMNAYFHEKYFKKRALNTERNVQLQAVNSVKKYNYEVIVKNLIRQAKPLRTSLDDCQQQFVPNNSQNETFVLYIEMNNDTDFVVWTQVAKCLQIWDLDARGIHKAMWRLFIRGNHLIIVGVPASPYSSFRPADLPVVSLTSSELVQSAAPAP